MKRIYSMLPSKVVDKVRYASCCFLVTETRERRSRLTTPRPSRHPPHFFSQIRGVLEFDGGITDTYLTAARTGIDPWNILTRGSARYRTPPGAQPQPLLPTAVPSRTYDIKYFPRDIRRNNDPLTHVRGSTSRCCPRV